MTTPASDPGRAASPPLDGRSRALRRQILRTFAAGGRGHLGSALSLVEILRVLYDQVLEFDPARPRWPARDRMILSKGHGCLALYAILADKGFFPEAELWTFCQDGGSLGGHPEFGKVPGVEASTGSLGHGLSIGVGMAAALRMDRNPARVFVLDSDGACDEGSLWEAALSAAQHRLDNLTVLLDYNRMQSYAGTSEVLELEPLADKWRAFGFAVREADGHDVAALGGALAGLPFAPGRPGILVCHTVKGKGIPFLEGNAAWHHRGRVTEAELAALFRELD
jgi:transketolase